MSSKKDQKDLSSKDKDQACEREDKLPIAKRHFSTDDSGKGKAKPSAPPVTGWFWSPRQIYKNFRVDFSLQIQSNPTNLLWRTSTPG